MQLTSPGTNGNSAGTVTDLPKDRPVVPVEKPAVNVGPRSGPPRGRGLSLAGRRRTAMVAATVFVVAVVLVGGAAVARKVLGGVPKVVVAVAGPANIDSQPGGVGSVGTLPQNIFSVSLDAVGVTAPITVTRVFVVPGTPVRVGSPLVALSPAPFRDNVEQLGPDPPAGRVDIGRRGERQCLGARHAGKLRQRLPGHEHPRAEGPGRPGQTAPRVSPGELHQHHFAGSGRSFLRGRRPRRQRRTRLAVS